MPDEAMSTYRLKKAFVQNAVLEKARVWNPERLGFSKLARKEGDQAILRIKGIGFRVEFAMKPGEFVFGTYFKDRPFNHKIILTDWANPDFDPDVIVNKIKETTDLVVTSLTGISSTLTKIWPETTAG